MCETVEHLHMLHILPPKFLCTTSQECSVTNQCVPHYMNEVSQTEHTKQDKTYRHTKQINYPKPFKVTV